jgi:hypothetical protein
VISASFDSDGGETEFSWFSVALVAVASKGLVRSAIGNGSNHIEWIPCDLACNGIIVYAAKVAAMKER